MSHSKTLGAICTNVLHMQGMAEAIQELTWEAGPEFTHVRSISFGISQLSETVVSRIEAIETEEGLKATAALSDAIEEIE